MVDDLATAPDVGSLLRALRRRWASALGLGLVLAVVSALSAWFFMPSPKFQAKATLHVASSPPRVLSTHSMERADFSTFLKTQVAMIKGRKVLVDLMARPGLADLPLFRSVADTIEWLEKEVQVEASGGSELLKISLKGEHPTDLARVVNELASTYLEGAREAENREKADRLRNLTENYAHYLEARQEQRRSLRGIAEEVGANDRRSISVKQELDLERLSLTRRELLYLQSDLRKSQVELGVLEAHGRQEPSQSVSAWAVAEAVASDPVVGAYAGRVVELEGRLASARRTIRGEHDPVIRGGREDLDATRKNLADRREQIMRSAGERMGEQSTRQLAERIASARERVAILGEHERILEGEVSRLDEAARSLNRTSLTLENSRGEIDQADEMVRKLAAEIESQKIEQMAPSRARMLEKAEVPLKRDARARLKATFAAAGMAFALSLLALTWRESQAGRVDSTGIVKSILGLKLLGVLPRLRDRYRARVSRPCDLQADRQSSLYFESIDATRAMILRALDGAPSCRVVLITSALKAEGKTSMSSHLAASLARAGNSTLLVDGDLRIPSAHKPFGLPSVPGLSEVMRGEQAVDGAIRPSPFENLMLLPAGECNAATLDALSRGKVGEIFAGLRERFDIILVDSSPILPVADPVLFGRHCDAIIFSILENVSTVPAIRAAFDRLGSLDVPVLGAVVAGSPMMNYRYQFYRKPPGRAGIGPAKPLAAPLPILVSIPLS